MRGGWPIARIGDIAEVSTGGTPSTSRPEFYGGDIRWAKSGDIKGPYIDETPNHLTQQGVEHSNARVHPAGTVLLAMSGQGSTRGRAAVLRVPSACSQSVAAILPSERATPDFIYFALSAQYDAIRRRTGNNERSGLNLQLVRDLEIPLPSLTEQTHIAATLVEEMAAAENARSAAEAQEIAVRDLFPVLLESVFQQLIQESDTRYTIGDVAEVQSGYAFRSEWFSKEGIRLLRNANVHQKFLDWSDVVHLPSVRRSEFSEFELARDDIVLALDRPLVGRGLKVAQVTEKDLPALLLQRVGRFLIRGPVSRDYLYFFLNSPQFIRAISGHDQSVGVPHISPKQVESVGLPLPSPDRQTAIANTIRRHMLEIHKCIDLASENSKLVAGLPTSYLRRTFAGTV